MIYRIEMTDEFERDFYKLDHSLQIQIDKEIRQLETNPYRGDPLGYKFLREKKVRNYRFYFLVYEEYVAVFLITISTKKDQQPVIDAIKNSIPFYREEIRKKLFESKG